MTNFLIDIQDQNGGTVDHGDCESYLLITQNRRMDAPMFHTSIHLRADPAVCFMLAQELREMADRVEQHIPSDMLKKYRKAHGKLLRRVPFGGSGDLG